MLALVALLPIAVSLVLMVGLRLPSTKVMPLSWLTGCLAAVLVWKLPLGYVLALSLQGMVNALAILVVIFGAILILYTQQRSGGMETIQYGLQRISPDLRVQAIIIGYLFASFIEGAAGFGAPAALAAPMLLSLGFPPLAAAVLCMIFNSYSVSFGGAGMPINMGIAPLKPLVIQALEQGTATGFADASGFGLHVGQWASLMHGPMILLLPVLVLGLVSRCYGPNRRWRDGFGAWKFCFFAAFAFGTPYFAFAWLAGPEFPSLAGSLVGLGITVAGAKKGFCLPDAPWNFGPASGWDPAWCGSAIQRTSAFTPRMSQFRAWLPYALVAVSLVLTRMPSLGIRQWLLAQTITVDAAFMGYPQVSAVTQYLYLPGVFPFIPVALLTIALHGMRLDTARLAWGEAMRTMRNPAIAIGFTVALVSIFRGSGVEDALLNPSAYPSMPLAMARTAAEYAGGVWPMLAGVIGGIGSFVTGSTTVSSLLLGEFQGGAATHLGLSRELCIAAQNAGAAVGNLISIQNTIAVCAVVGLSGSEGLVLRQTFRAFVGYSLVVGFITTALVTWVRVF